MKACDKVSQRLIDLLTLSYHLDYDDVKFMMMMMGF